MYNKNIQLYWFKRGGEMQIRQATFQDAKAIAKVHVDSWRTTYQGIIPDSYLDSLSYEQRTELWQRNIADEGNYIVVAEDEAQKIIGFGTAGKRPENKEVNAGDLTSIYLLEAFQGKGIGKLLLTELFRYFKEQSYKKVFVEVLEENKTRHFYEYYGAVLVKKVEIKISGEVLNELIYVWNDVEGVYLKCNGQ
ncbi:GNAT family N-acetyltransferase [Ralstonia pickettii]|nr:GNAT family N-acetyltransferase [Ralstonia pickettii]